MLPCTYCITLKFLVQVIFQKWPTNRYKYTNTDGYWCVHVWKFDGNALMTNNDDHLVYTKTLKVKEMIHSGSMSQFRFADENKRDPIFYFFLARIPLSLQHKSFLVPTISETMVRFFWFSTATQTCTEYWLILTFESQIFSFKSSS